MDSLTAASARMLAAGDVLGALGLVALRDDPPALALRGVAMARLGDHTRARDLLRRAARGFGTHEPLERARCIVAEAEVALAMRELDQPVRALPDALITLESHRDHANVVQARLVMARRALLLGRLQDAANAIAALDTNLLPAALAAVTELVVAELSLRSLLIEPACIALQRAHAFALQSANPALQAEVALMQKAMTRPAARLMSGDTKPLLTIEAIASLLSSAQLVVDGCRRTVSANGSVVSLATRPILFELVRALALAWPGDVTRQSLIAHVFRLRHQDETHRARLRVQIGRLRKLLRHVVGIEATRDGYALLPMDNQAVSVLAPPIDSEAATLLALLADGAAWSTSALAQASGASQRSVQRALAELQASGQVNSIGRSRAQRWVCPSLAGFTTILLLPAVLPLK